MSFHGVESDHVSLGVANQGDETVLPDGHFFQLHLASRSDRFRRSFVAVFAGEIDDGAAGALGVHHCLLPGLHDTREDARDVARFCDGLGHVLVQLIPYSPGNAPLTRAPEEEVERIIGWLREDGLPVRRRITEGRDVMAACGQLGNVELRRSRSLSRPCRPPTCGSPSSARVLTFILAAVALACGWLLHG